MNSRGGMNSVLVQVLFLLLVPLLLPLLLLVLLRFWGRLGLLPGRRLRGVGVHVRGIL
jgi:hypothetical protein